MTTNLIVLPKKVENATQPKPRRSEIIEVMARRLIERDAKARAEESIKLGKRNEELNTELRAIDISKLTPTLKRGYRAATWNGEETISKGNYSGIGLDFDITPVVPAELHRKLVKYADDLNTHIIKYRWLDDNRWRRGGRIDTLKTAKAKARALLGEASTVSAVSRVPAMLKDESLVKSIDAFIKKLENAPTDKLAIAV